MEADSACRAILAATPLSTRDDSLATAATLDLLAESLWRRLSALPADADSLSRRAIQLREALHGERSLQTAASLTHRARVLRKLKRTPEGIELMRRVLRLQSELAAPDSSIAVGETAVARMFAERQELDSAQVYDHRALDRRVRSLGAMHVDVGKSCNSIALNYAALGRYADARESFEHARRVFEAASPPDTTILSLIYESLAGNLLFQGRGREALPLAARARAMAHARGVPAAVDENYAAALWNVGLADSSRAVYRQVIERYVNAGKLLDEARARSTWGGAEADVSTSDEALQNLVAAGRLIEKAGQLRSVFRADQLLGLTHLLSNRGDLLGARASSDSAVAICDAVLAPLHPEGIRAYHDAGWLRFVQGEPAAALPYEFESCRRALEHLKLSYQAMSEEDALRYNVTVPPLAYAVAASIVADLGDRARTAAGAHAESLQVVALWNVAISTRSLVLSEMAARRAIAYSGRADLDSLLRARRGVTRSLAGMLIAGAGRNPTADAARLQQLRTEEQAIERAIAVRSRPFRERALEMAADHAAVARALRPGQVLVAFTVFHRWNADSLRAVLSESAQRHDGSLPPTDRHARPVLAAFVQRGAAPPDFLALGDADSLAVLADAWRAAIAREVERPELGSRESDRLGTALRRGAWDPLANLVAGASQVFVVPDGPMYLVQPTALPAPAGGYLIETLPPLQVLDTERELVTLPAARRSGAGLLAMGAPDFDHAGAAPAARNPGASARAGSPLATNLRSAPEDCAEFRAARFTPLPGAAAEVHAVQALWSRFAPVAGRRSACLTGTDAAESALEARAARCRVLHLATHGFFLSADCSGDSLVALTDPLLRSGLAMAGANQRGVGAVADAGSDDGMLTAAEIATLDLSGVDWVVLSACNTATGSVRNGEGVFGLRRAFAVAGAGTTIMSLWKVDDLATNRWMQLLYEGRLRDRLPTAQAVRRASLTLLRERRALGRSTSPGFWGAFIAAGDWR